MTLSRSKLVGPTRGGSSAAAAGRRECAWVMASTTETEMAGFSGEAARSDCGGSLLSSSLPSSSESSSGAAAATAPDSSSRSKIPCSAMRIGYPDLSHRHTSCARPKILCQALPYHIFCQDSIWGHRPRHSSWPQAPGILRDSPRRITRECAPLQSLFYLPMRPCTPPRPIPSTQHQISGVRCQLTPRAPSASRGITRVAGMTLQSLGGRMLSVRASVCRGPPPRPQARARLNLRASATQPLMLRPPPTPQAPPCQPWPKILQPALPQMPRRLPAMSCRRKSTPSWDRQRAARSRERLSKTPRRSWLLYQRL
eukprot:m.65900 g.65900  ORF g.65900 m.65900 type:complete len:312 (-) comp7362_c0_seq1:393-1328(-)